VFDEVAFWRDESSATPDTEMYRAVLPSLATTKGVLIGISTPYRKLGLLHEKHRDHFSRNDDDVLVCAGASRLFNPSLSDVTIAAQRQADPVGAVAEWDAEFRNDISSFLDDASIDTAIDYSRPAELQPRENTLYHSFVDMSGGGSGAGADASTLVVGHLDGERFIADVVRGRHGDPHAAALDYSQCAKQYHCRVIWGDAYSKEWCAGFYRSAGGLDYRQSPLTRSQLYLEGQVHFTRGLVSIPANPTLLRELRLLERRVARSGKDSVDHGIGGHDDYSNSLFGCLYVAMKATKQRAPKIVSPAIFSKQMGWIGTGAANTAGKSTTQAYYDWVNGGGSYWPGSGPREW
jgi:hypothetical protein